MAEATADCAAFDETVVFLSHFNDPKDPRQQGKVDYPLEEILLLCLIAVLAGAETITDIALFGRKKLDLLRRFRRFANGTPAHDHLGDILAVLDPEQFQRCFVAWVAALTGTPEGVIAIDGKKADYVLALKGNQGSLREDVELFVAEQKAAGFRDTTISRDQTVDGDHGRIETRTTTVIHDLGWLQERHNWPGLKAVVVVESERDTGDKIERETRFYLTSLALMACMLGPIVRSHWAIENSLHWILDMVFRDDECRLRTDHAPANFCTIKHMAQNLIRLAPGKASLRLKRKTAGWDDHFLASLITR